MSPLIYGAAAAALLTFAAPAYAQMRHPLHPTLEQTPPSSAPAQHATPATPPPEDAQAMSATPAAPLAPAAAATPAQPGVYTDAQLSNFVAASTEIQPLTANVATATPDQRAQITTQIRAALQRHNIDSATYNQIASAAQTDTALAARINGFRSGATASGMASAAPTGTPGSANMAMNTPSAGAHIGASTSGESVNAGSNAGVTAPPSAAPQPVTPPSTRH